MLGFLWDSSHFNTLGLVLDGIGFAFLYFYGVVPFLIQPMDGSDTKETRYYKRRGLFGFVLVLIGFGCQIISNYIPPQ